MTDLPESPASPFDEIRQLDDDGSEYRSGRDLAKLLGYTDLRNFWNSVEKALEACGNSGNNPEDHFGDVTYMVPIGSGTERGISDVFLTAETARHRIAQETSH